MAVNLKNITELPVVESADGLNLIVNDNGSAKQIAASAVGAQADFNVTDETHPAYIKNKPVVVQSDWAVTDENSPAFIKNKPVEEWDLDITVNASLNMETGEITLIPTVNSGEFNIVKNKILANEKTNFKVQTIFTPPHDSTITGYENNVIYTTLYAPQNLFGADSNPELIALVYQSFCADGIIEIDMFADNTLGWNFY